MANSTSHILDYPIKKCRFTLPLTFRTSAGTPTDPTTPDTEVSSDGGATFADCTEEITTGGSNGAGYITLTSAETDNNVLVVAAKSANCLTTLAVLYPRVLASIGTGTLSAGSAGGGTLGTLLAYDVTGCYIKTTGGTGGAAGSLQARKIVTYNTGSGAFTVTPNWETTPDNTTTYDVLLPEGVTLGMLKTLNPTTAGNTLDVSSGGEAGLDWGNIGSKTTTNALTGTTIATTQKVDVDTIKTQTLTAAAGITFGVYVGGTAAAAVASTALSTAQWTSARAGYLDNINNSNLSSVPAFPSNFASLSISVSGIVKADDYNGNHLLYFDYYDADTRLTSGTAAGGAAGSITLAAGASSVNDFYVGRAISIISGTGVGQTRTCTAYNGTTKVATISPNWATTPSGGPTYFIGLKDVTGVYQTGDSYARIGAAGVGLTSVIAASVTGNVGGDVVGKLLGTASGGGAITGVGARVYDETGEPVAKDTDLTDLITTVGVAGLGLSAIPKTGYKLASDGTDLVLVDGKTLRAALQIIAALAGGQVSGAGTGTETFKGLDGSTTRAVVTVDGSGNRTGITYP